MSDYKLRLPSRFVSHLEGSSAYAQEEGESQALIDLVCSIVDRWQYGKPVVASVPEDLVRDFLLYAKLMQPETSDLAYADSGEWSDMMGDLRAGRSVLKQIDKIDAERGVRRNFSGRVINV